MKRSIKNVLAMLVCGLFLGDIPVYADVIYNPVDILMDSFGTVLVVGGAIAVLVAVTVGLLAYLKKTKKKSQSEDKEEKL